jgi:branched-chain amino acid transport system ATP-binding protein
MRLLYRFDEERAMPMLEVENLNSYYVKIHALKDVSITVEKGEVVTIIGANGAGKSTMLRTTSGLLKPRSGSIRLEGEEITRLRPHEIVMKGVVQVPEGRRVFGRLTVKENLERGLSRAATAATTRRIWSAYSPFSRGSRSAASRSAAP